MIRSVFKPALTAAFLFAAIGVILGAMGAHALRDKLAPELLTSFETAVRYQLYHSFALAIAGILYGVFPNKWMKAATWLFVGGIILFSGSIYLLVELKSTSDIGLGKLGLITPIGGVLMILGWLCMLVAIYSKPKTTV
jgi:uncharacterized membrane protein YgdD (TMEM256/DUF423 family)